MKRILSGALALALTLSLSVNAFASFDIDTKPMDSSDITVTIDTTEDQDVEVTLDVAPSYTVTIPQKVELAAPAAGSTESNYTQDAAVSAENVLLKKGEVLKVTINSASEFKMAEETDSNTQLAYTVKVNDSADAIVNDGEVAAFESKADEQSVTLHFATTAAPAYAGTYKDTVTFTIAVAEATAVNP